jgi:L-amino acid N-acyltransferase YncA
VSSDYDIGLATAHDIPGILALQEENFIDTGGSLSERLPADWLADAMQEMPFIVARRDSKVVGYMEATSVAAQMHIPIVQAVVARFPPAADCFIQGPVCVAQSERGKGLVGLLFGEMRAQLPGRASITFIRSDNAASLRAHQKVGIRVVGEFEHGGARYSALCSVP